MTRTWTWIPAFLLALAAATGARAAERDVTVEWQAQPWFGCRTYRFAEAPPPVDADRRIAGALGRSLSRRGWSDMGDESACFSVRYATAAAGTLVLEIQEEATGAQVFRAVAPRVLDAGDASPSQLDRVLDRLFADSPVEPPVRR
jgi:hypothetical protein